MLYSINRIFLHITEVDLACPIFIQNQKLRDSPFFLILLPTVIESYHLFFFISPRKENNYLLLVTLSAAHAEHSSLQYTGISSTEQYNSTEQFDLTRVRLHSAEHIDMTTLSKGISFPDHFEHCAR